MNTNDAYAVIEAILFSMGDSVEISKIADALGLDKNETRRLLEEYGERLKEDDRGLKLVALEDSYQLCTKPEMYEFIVKVASRPKRMVLTDVLLETLSIIAYRQPVTKSGIESIRGVRCDHAVNKLIEYELVEEVGRLDSPGHPILFGTTEEFLRRFGVESKSGLPRIDEDKVRDFKAEAEREADLKV